MKKFIYILFILLIIQITSAIRINEVELNPAGKDTGSEWVEFYSEDEISLNNYRLVNNDGNELILNGNFSGYYVYTFSKQWLDNSDEKILLYEDDELIDETDILWDSKNNEFTSQLCEIWKFKESTKGEENNCDEGESEEDLEDNEENFVDNDEDLSGKNNQEQEEIEDKQTKITGEVISLTPKNIKSDENVSNSSNTKKYAIYGFVFFCILILLLFGLKFFRRTDELE